MEHIIKRLGAGQVQELRDMNALFARAFDDAESYLENPPTQEYLQGLLKNPAIIFLHSRQDRQPNGALVAYILPKFEQARSEIYIYDLAVDEAFRRRGIATALIRETQRIAKEIGAWVVYVQADHDDPPARTLYEKLGVKEEVLHFDLNR